MYLSCYSGVWGKRSSCHPPLYEGYVADSALRPGDTGGRARHLRRVCAIGRLCTAPGAWTPHCSRGIPAQRPGPTKGMWRPKMLIMCWQCVGNGAAG